MEKILTLVLVVWCVSSGASRAKNNYNSSDISYLSNGIQFPVPPSDLPNPAEEPLFQDRNDTLSEIRWLASLFDHLRWPQMLKNVNENCSRDVETYIRSLQNGTSWAAKMYDASGRYSGQFFFGNDYWLGSRTLCKELTNEETNAETPPFPVTFMVAKIRVHINRNLTPVTRQLNVGQCLPASCGLSDVRLLLSKERRSGTILNVVGVRKVPGTYQVYKDPKFQIVGGVSLAVGVLILIASIVEYQTEKQRKKEGEMKNDAETANNNNNNNGEEPKVLRKKEEKVKSERVKQGLLLRFLLSFSAINNGKKIFNIDAVSDDSILCIHGLRFFSIAWVIMVHTYLEVFSIAENKNMRILTERSFMYQTIANATFSVDTFFFIGGLLVTITFMRSSTKKQAKKQDQKEESTCQVVRNNTIQFFMLIIYRFFRLTPAYLFVLGANEVIMRFLHDYSVFTPAIIDHISCSAFWWRNALYINNFYPQTEFCMLWSWYIANDTQFYVIAAVLLLIAVRGSKHLKFAAAALGVFMVASWAMTFIIAMKYNYTIRVEEPFALFDQLYDKPWMRIGPYFIGMMAGYLLFSVKGQLKLSPFVVTAGWILSLGCLTSLVYSVGRQGLVIPASAFYASLGHTAWGLSLAWITVACCWGYGGPVNAFLKFKLFLPLSRLTYCAYLVHPVLMCLTSFILDGPLHLHEAMMIVIFCGNIIFSFISAFAISIFYEAPVVNLLKIILL